MNSAVRARLERPPQFTWLFLFLMLLLIWVPIPIGSNRPWSQGLLTAISLTLAGLWVFAYARSPFEIPETLRALKLPGYLFGIWALYPIFQLLPFPTAGAVGARCSAKGRLDGNGIVVLAPGINAFRRSKFCATCLGVVNIFR